MLLCESMVSSGLTTSLVPVVLILCARWALALIDLALIKYVQPAGKLC